MVQAGLILPPAGILATSWAHDGGIRCGHPPGRRGSAAGYGWNFCATHTLTPNLPSTPGNGNSVIFNYGL